MAVEGEVEILSTLLVYQELSCLKFNQNKHLWWNNKLYSNFLHHYLLNAIAKILTLLFRKRINSAERSENLNDNKFKISFWDFMALKKLPHRLFKK